MRAAPPPAARATPRGRQWTKERVVEDAVPYRAGGKRTACRGIYCEVIPRPGGGWRNVIRQAIDQPRDVGDAVPYRAGAPP